MTYFIIIKIKLIYVYIQPKLYHIFSQKAKFLTQNSVNSQGSNKSGSASRLCISDRASRVEDMPGIDIFHVSRGDNETSNAAVHA